MLHEVGLPLASSHCCWLRAPESFRFFTRGVAWRNRSDIPHTRRVLAALQRRLPVCGAVGTMGGEPTYVERATEGTECLPAKLKRAIDCMRLIAGRTKF